MNNVKEAFRAKRQTAQWEINFLQDMPRELMGLAGKCQEPSYL